MKWKLLRSLAVLSLLSLVLGLAPPVQASTGDAKIVIRDLTTGGSFVCSSTTSLPACTWFTILSGHQYEFKATEVAGAPFKRGKIKLIDIRDAWTNISTNFGGTGDGCTYNVQEPTTWECWSSSNSITFVSITATSTQWSYEDNGVAEIERVSTPTKTAPFSYRPYITQTVVKTCNGFVVGRDTFGDYNLAKNTCYKVTVQALDGGSFDKMYLSLQQGLNLTNFTGVTWSYTATSTPTCTTPNPPEHECHGSAGSRIVTTVSAQGTTLNGSANGQFLDIIYMLSSPTSLDSDAVEYHIG